MGQTTAAKPTSIPMLGVIEILVLMALVMLVAMMQKMAPHATSEKNDAYATGGALFWGALLYWHWWRKVGRSAWGGALWGIALTSGALVVGTVIGNPRATLTLDLVMLGLMAVIIGAVLRPSPIRRAFEWIVPLPPRPITRLYEGATVRAPIPSAGPEKASRAQRSMGRRLGFLLATVCRKVAGGWRVILLILLVLWASWMFRYEPLARAPGYALDRWTHTIKEIPLP